MSRIALRNFTGGQVTPTLSARYDLKKFGSFMQVCENFVPNLHGDVERRPGMQYVAPALLKCILVPFIFNSEPENNYALMFYPYTPSAVNPDIGTVAVVSEDGLVGSTPMSHTYTEDELYQLSFAQVADVLYIAHPKHPLAKLYRQNDETLPEGQYEWTLEDVSINKSLPAPEKPTVTFVRDNEDDDAELNYELRYKIVAVDADGVESVGSEAGVETEGKFPTDWVVGNHVELSWKPVPGADHYNIYRESAGYYGLIGISKERKNGKIVFEDQNYEADTSMTPKEDWNPFVEVDDEGNETKKNPACVCFHGQRMWVAGGDTEPATMYASRTGDFENFRKSFPLQDDDPLEFMIASGSIDDIRWMTSFNKLVVGTAGAEYTVDSSGPAISPSDCQIRTQSFWGSAYLAPLLIGQSIIHCQRSGNHVRDLYYTWESDGYAGNDLSILAPQLVEGHVIKQWAYQQYPTPCIWAVRDDWKLLCLTYMKEQNVFGWSVHETDGDIVSVAVINGRQQDVVMVVVQRGETYTVEKLSEKFSDKDTMADAQFLDCARTFNGVSAVSGTETIDLTYVIGHDTEVDTGTPYDDEGNPLAGDTLVVVIAGDQMARDMKAQAANALSTATGRTVKIVDVTEPYTSKYSGTPDQMYWTQRRFVAHLASYKSTVDKAVEKLTSWTPAGVWWCVGETEEQTLKPDDESSAYENRIANFKSQVETLLAWNPFGSEPCQRYISTVPAWPTAQRYITVASDLTTAISGAVTTTGNSATLITTANSFDSTHKIVRSGTNWGLTTKGAKALAAGFAAQVATDLEISAEEEPYVEPDKKTVRVYETVQDYITVNKLAGLEGKTVTALIDGEEFDGIEVSSSGAITLPKEGDKVTIGLPFKSLLCPMPVDTDAQGGTTLSKYRAYGKAILRLYRSLGGEYAASRATGLYDTDSWEWDNMEIYPVPYWNNSSDLLSGDVELILPSGQDADTSLWLMTDSPYPFRVVSIAIDVDFGEV